MSKKLKIEYYYRASPTLKEFHLDDSFVRGIRGPIGSGKSVACCQEVFFRCREQAPNSAGIRLSRWVITRNTYSELKTTTIKTWQDWFAEEDSPVKFGSPFTSRLRLPLEDGTKVDADIIFLSLDRDADVKKLKSLELTGGWMNEAGEQSKAVFDMLCGRVGRYPPKKDALTTWSGVIMDTNPPSTSSWWYKLAEEDRPDTFKFYSQPPALLLENNEYRLNPDAENVKHQPLGSKYWLRQIAGKEPEWIKVFLMGEYGSLFDGKPVYQTYNDNVHCTNVTYRPELPIYRGWDFGLTPCCVFAQFSGGQLVFLDELTSERAGADSFSDIVVPYSAQNFSGAEFYDIGDPAGAAGSQTDERSCFDILHGKDIWIEPGEISERIRIESIRKPLNTMIDGYPGLVIDPKCKILRKGFQGGYKYRKLQISGERYTPHPEKDMYSHSHDAAQYIGAFLFADVLRGYQEDVEEYDNTQYGDKDGY